MIKASLCGLAAAIGLMTSASAAVWNKDGSGSTDGNGCASSSTNYGSGGCTISNSAVDALNVDLRMRGYANTGTNGAWTSQTLVSMTNPNGRGEFGMSSDGSTSPNHAIDNNGRKEAVLLDFSKGGVSTAVALSQIQIGWWNTDYDITVLRYTGNTAPTYNSNLLSGWGVTNANSNYNFANSGWSVMGNYAFNESAPGTSCNGSGTATQKAACERTIDLGNDGSVTSSYWLVMAYTSAFGGTNYGGSNGGTNLSLNNDYFKLMAVATTAKSNDTPEPGALFLAAMGLITAGVVRRRKSGK